MQHTLLGYAAFFIGVLNMQYILQVDFPFSGPFGEAMTEAMRPLAEDIATEAELLWKIWTENPATQEAGGVYLFASEAAAERYLVKHTQRLNAAGVENIRGKIFAVNQPLSEIDRAPLK